MLYFWKIISSSKIKFHNMWKKSTTIATIFKKLWLFFIFLIVCFLGVLPNSNSQSLRCFHAMTNGDFLHCSVPLHMSPQRTWVRAGKVTLAAFVWFFSTVWFQMFPQMAWLRRCKVTLVAFVWLFSTVNFQMCPQIVCPRRDIATLVAFV